MQKKKLIIIGSGGHGRSLAESVLLGDQFELSGFVDDSWPQNKAVWSYPVLGDTSELSQYRAIAEWAIVAIGNNKLRSKMLNQLSGAGFQLATVIHPAAIVSPSAMVGIGTAIMAGAIIGTEAELGVGVIVNSGANVDHHCKVGDFGHLGVNACMAGGSILEEGAWIQAGAALGYGVKVPMHQIIEPGVGLKA